MSTKLPSSPRRRTRSARAPVASDERRWGACEGTRAFAGTTEKCVMPDRDRTSASLGFLRADLLVPDAERFDLCLRFERLGVRKFLEPRFVLGTPVFLDRVLAFLGRHR